MHRQRQTHVEERRSRKDRKADQVLGFNEQTSKAKERGISGGSSSEGGKNRCPRTSPPFLSLSLFLSVSLTHCLQDHGNSIRHDCRQSRRKKYTRMDASVAEREREKERKIDLPAHDESASAITATLAFPSRLTQLSLHPLSLSVSFSRYLSAQSEETRGESKSRRRERERKGREEEAVERRRRTGEEREREKERTDRPERQSLPSPLSLSSSPSHRLLVQSRAAAAAAVTRNLVFLGAKGCLMPLFVRVTVEAIAPPGNSGRSDGSGGIIASRCSQPRGSTGAPILPREVLLTRERLF